MTLQELATRIKSTQEFPTVDVDGLDNIDYIEYIIRYEVLTRLRNYDGIKGHELDALMSKAEAEMKADGHTFTNRSGYELASWQSFVKAVVNGEYDESEAIQQPQPVQQQQSQATSQRLTVNLKSGVSYQPINEYDYTVTGNFDAHFPPATNAEMETAGNAFADMTVKHTLNTIVSKPSLTADDQAEIARSWGLVPDQKNRRRVRRAIEIVQQHGVKWAGKLGNDDTYSVMSQSEKNKAHAVAVNGSAACGCESFRNSYHDPAVICGHTSYCKHGDAAIVANYLDLLSIPDEVENEPEPVITTEGNAVLVNGAAIGEIFDWAREDVYTHSSASKCMQRYFDTRAEAIASLLRAEGYSNDNMA